MESSSEELSEEESLELRCIRLVQGGSKEAFALLVQQHQGIVFSAIVRRGINSAIAKELTQEVMLKAYLNINSFRFQAAFSTWLLRIAVNHSNSYYHSRAYKESQKTITYEQDDSILNKQADGFDRDALRHLQHLVFDLPEPLQEVMVLYAFEQRSYEEIASLLELPVGTVRSRLYRARAQLKIKYFSDESEV